MTMKLLIEATATLREPNSAPRLHDIVIGTATVRVRHRYASCTEEIRIITTVHDDFPAYLGLVAVCEFCGRLDFDDSSKHQFVASAP